MIYIDRGQPPDGFIAQTERWLNDFETAQPRNPKQTPSKFWSKVRQRKPMRRYAQALYEAFYGKCAFCESKMRHVSPGQIEHYRPKSQYHRLMFAWENWLLACGACNNHKGAAFPMCADELPCLLDPASEDPAPHFAFIRAEMLPKTERGRESLRLVNLARTDLLEVRAQWLIQIDLLLLLILHVPAAKTEARHLLIWAMQPEAPYAAMTRAYLAVQTPKLANPPTPHPIITLTNPVTRLIALVDTYRATLAEVVA